MPNQGAQPCNQGAVEFPLISLVLILRRLLPLGTQAAKTKHCNGAPSIGGWSQSGLYAPGLPGRVVVSMAARLPNTRRSAFNFGSTALKRKPVSEKAGLVLLQKETPPRERPDSVHSSLRFRGASLEGHTTGPQNGRHDRSLLPGAARGSASGEDMAAMQGRSTCPRYIGWLELTVPCVVTADAHSLWRRR